MYMNLNSDTIHFPLYTACREKVASFPVPCPAFRRKAGHGTGDEAREKVRAGVNFVKCPQTSHMFVVTIAVPCVSCFCPRKDGHPSKTISISNPFVHHTYIRMVTHSLLGRK